MSSVIDFLTPSWSHFFFYFCFVFSWIAGLAYWLIDHWGHDDPNHDDEVPYLFEKFLSWLEDGRLITDEKIIIRWSFLFFLFCWPVIMAVDIWQNRR